MKLKTLVVASAIYPGLKARKRDEALAELLDAFLAAAPADAQLGSGLAAQRDALLKALIRREKRGSTGFGHGVAVPHVKLPGNGAPRAAIGLSEAGIEFGALDRAPVFSMFMLFSGEDNATGHLEAMESIFGSLSSERFRSFLRQARRVEDVLTLLDEADSGLHKG